MPYAYSSRTAIKPKEVYRSDTSKTIKLIQFRITVTKYDDVLPKRSSNMIMVLSTVIQVLLCLACNYYHVLCGNSVLSLCFSVQTITSIHLAHSDVIWSSSSLNASFPSY